MTSARILAGRYELLKPIGQGGMGQVWSALDTRLQRQVAVKTVDLNTTTDAVAAERFSQEAQATAALNHPNIVTIFDSGIDGGTAFLVMELLPGPSLESMVVAHGPLVVDQALDYAGQVASALGAAHAAGIVHRDIKPSNLMLDGRGALKVVDFGIARLDQDRASKLTATATVMGSAPYLSPEQATGATATPQSDLYSLGCVLTALLTGAPPFEGEHPLAVLNQHLSAPPPMPSSLRPDVPSAVDGLVAQLLAKSPADRPASARDVADRVAAIRRGQTAGGALPPATEALPLVEPQTAYLPPVPEQSPSAGLPSAGYYQVSREQPVVAAHQVDVEPARKRGAGWVLPALLALVVLAGIGWYLTLGPGGGKSPAPAPVPTATLSEQVTSPVVEPSTTQPTSTTADPSQVPPTTTKPRRPRQTSTAPTTTPPTPTRTPTRTPTTAPTSTTPTTTEPAPVPTLPETTAPETVAPTQVPTNAQPTQAPVTTPPGTAAPAPEPEPTDPATSAT